MQLQERETQLPGAAKLQGKNGSGGRDMAAGSKRPQAPGSMQAKLRRKVMGKPQLREARKIWTRNLALRQRGDKQS